MLVLLTVGDVKQLRHDLQNGPNHLFGDHHACNPAFCEVALIKNDGSSDSDGDSDSGNGVNSTNTEQTLTQQLEDIVESELDDEPSATAEHEARGGGSTIVNCLPVGLIEKVKACGDCLVMLSAQVVGNETSNLAECYMSICSVFDGGNQYDCVQSGAFEGRCYAAGMRVQAGPTWQLDTLEHVTGETSGKVSLQYIAPYIM